MQGVVKKTADNDEWDWTCQTHLNQCALGKIESSDPSPLCPHSVQKVWTPLLILKSNLFYQKKNKFIAAKSIYTNEKQCLSPSSIDNHLIWIAPIFKRKSCASHFYDFYKNLNHTYKQGISYYGTTIQFCSDFPHMYSTLISIIKYVITKNQLFRGYR